VDGGSGGHHVWRLHHVAGVAPTTPVFLYGIPYFHNTFDHGNVSRHQPDAELRSGERGLPAALRCRFPCCARRSAGVEQSLGTDALKSQVCTRISQIQAYEEMGFAKQEILMNKRQDPGLTDSPLTWASSPSPGASVRNIHADQTRHRLHGVRFMAQVVWGRRRSGSRTAADSGCFQIYDPASGNPTANEGCY